MFCFSAEQQGRDWIFVVVVVVVVDTWFYVLGSVCVSPV